MSELLGKSETKNLGKSETKNIAAEEKKKAEPAAAPQPEAKPEIKEEIKVVVKETPAAAVEVKQPEPVKKEAPKQTAAVKGSWQIQLISSPNKSAMDKAWKDLSKKYAALKDLPHEVQEADLGSKGIFYRLMAGAFEERSAADKVCNAVKSAGGSCLVKKK